MQTNMAIEQQKKEFQLTLSKLSHEIRNPVALINSELQLLASRYPEIEDLDGWDNVMDNLEYIKDLLNELSDYNNASRLSPEPTDPGKYLRSIVASIKPTLDYLGIALETEIPQDLPVISIDRIKMRQVLLNLLRNAEESISHSEGKITIQAKAWEHGICISIQDNGCGIEEAHQKEIFTPFITYKTNGTGLGLAVAKEVVDAHKGQLLLESAPNQGTSFRIFLG